MPELNNPIALTVVLNENAAYVVGSTQTFSELILFGSLRHYRANFTNADEAGVQQPFDLTGWQLRHQIGASVEYTGGSGTVPAVVIANADVADFTISADVVEWDLDCNTDEFLDAITDPSISRIVTVRAELWGRYGSSGPWQPLARWDLKITGAVFDTTQTPTSTADTYYTAPQIDAKIIVPAGLRFRVNADGTFGVESIS